MNYRSLRAPARPRSWVVLGTLLLVALLAARIADATAASQQSPDSTEAAAPLGQLPEIPPNAWTIPADPADAVDAPLDAVMPVDPDIIIGQLDNGLRYFIRENGYPEERAELRLVVNAGSVLEDEDQLGLAHFVEHMAFNGTAHFPKQDLIKALESFGMRFGADINAYTSFDETVYFLKIPTDEVEIIDTAYQILGDWASSVTFEDEELDKERGVVIEEWRLGLGAGARVRDQQFPILFHGSRYADRLPIGTLENLQTFEHDAVRRFYRDWYRPDLMAVIAVGDFDKNDIEARIREQFAGLENPEQPRPRPVYDVPEHDETLFGIATDPEATNTSVAVYHKLPIRVQGTHGTYLRSLIESLYSNMFNRRLAEVSQQPNPPFLQASAQQDILVPTREAYVLGAAVARGGVEAGVEALFREAERVTRFGFTESELERERSQILRIFERIYTERAVQDSELFVEEFQRAFLEGESVPGIDYEWALYNRFMPEITLEEVNRAAEEWLPDRSRVVLVAAPTSDAVTLPSEPELLAALDRARSGRLMPYRDTVTDAPLLEEPPDPGEIVEESFIEELDITEWTLSNGVRVVLKPTDFREEQILFRAFSPGGTSLASDEDYVAALTAVQVISASGFGNFSPRQITNMLADKVVEAQPTIGSLEEGFQGGAAPRDIETLMQLIYLKFTAPRADSGAFRFMTDRIRADLANRNVSPEAAFREKLQQTLSQNHFRRRPLTVDLVEEMDLRASYDFYRDRFADAGDFTFVFAGNLDLERMRTLVPRYLGALPATGREESWRDEGIDYPEGVIRETVRRGLEPKSITAIVFTGELEEDPPHRRALPAMASVLQTRLREVLREDLGGTYTVQVDASSSRIPDREYSISIFYGSDPGRAEELTDVIFEEIEKLQQEGPTAQEVDNVKASLRRSFETDSKRNIFWVERLVAAYRDHGDPLEIVEYLDELDELGPEMIRSSAIAYFDFDRYVKVTLLPEESGDGSGPRP